MPVDASRCQAAADDLTESLLNIEAQHGNVSAFSSPMTQPGWTFMAASRQSTSESTVASDADPRWSPRERINSLKMNLNTKLSFIPEQRGWRYFFMHKVGPHVLTLVAGVLIGVLVNTMIVNSTVDAEPYKIEPSPLAVPPEYMASAPLDNSPLIPNLEIPTGPQTFDACGFVIKSTDAVWNLRDDVDAAIDKYFHPDYFNAGSWGRAGVGLKVLREAIYGEMRAFPDIKIHITDCVCKGNDINGYKCAMPDVLTGTNTGPSAYGPATGRYARWTGLVQSLVKKNPVNGQWQYYAEWGVHDEWALIQQLGLDFARVPHPPTNTQSFRDGEPLFTYHGRNGEPLLNKDDVARQIAAER